MNELVYWIWLSLACTPGTQTFKKLIDELGTAENIYLADEHRLTNIISDKTSECEALANKELDEAERIYAFCTKYKVGILTYSDTKYPQSLKEISNPPVLLYYRGRLPDFDKYCAIAMVGTRRLSSYGRKNAYDISRDLAMAGALIVSGMAIGIDGMAAAGALSVGAPTVAVLGSGINVCYPPQHLTLAQNIVKNGCVLTEYPPNSEPAGYHFPKRNRIISGLSRAVIVVEGSERSGSLITAATAKEQGRQVYALPGYVGNRNSEATNLLIREGASLVTSADDIVHDLDKRGERRLNPFNMPQKRKNDMFDVMTELKISALTPDDDVFRPSRRRITSREEISREEVMAQAGPSAAATVINDVNSDTYSREPAVQQSTTGFKFDAKTLTVYKRIPEGAECSYDSLVGGDISITDVMTAVLKLQVGGFVKLHPGDFVSRKLKY